MSLVEIGKRLGHGIANHNHLGPDALIRAALIERRLPEFRLQAVWVGWTANPDRLKAELWRGSWVQSARFDLGEFSPRSFLVGRGSLCPAGGARGA